MGPVNIPVPVGYAKDYKYGIKKLHTAPMYKYSPVSQTTDTNWVDAMDFRVGDRVRTVVDSGRPAVSGIITDVIDSVSVAVKWDSPILEFGVSAQETVEDVFDLELDDETAGKREPA
jgi:hypothetical protein